MPLDNSSSRRRFNLQASSLKQACVTVIRLSRARGTCTPYTARRNVVIIKVGDSMHNTFATSAPRPGTCQRTTSGVYLASEPPIPTTGPVRNVAAAHTGVLESDAPTELGDCAHAIRMRMHETVCVRAGDNCATPVSATPGHRRADPTQNWGLVQVLSQREINVQPHP